METIEHNGVTFVKATDLAKKYRYTTDYIGQLCRGGKIEAKLIGRAWFVNEKSLKEHKNDRYSSVRSSDITINKSVVSDREANAVSVRREVRPVLSKTTHRSFAQQSQPVTYNFSSKGAERVSTYHGDDNQLEPIAHVKLATKPETELHPEISLPKEKSHKINVSLGEKASRKLTFEDLPEISLRGDLTISSLDDPDFFAEVEPVRVESIQFTPESIVKPKVLVTKRYQAPQPREYIPATIAPTEMITEEVVVKSTLAPKSAVAEVSQAASVRFVVVPVLVSIALAVCVLILGLASYAETDGVELRQTVAFSSAAVIESLSKFPESY